MKKILFILSLALILVSCSLREKVPFSTLSVRVSPSGISMEREKTQQFTAVVYNSKGEIIDRPITWRLESGGHGSITATGLYTAPLFFDNQLVDTIIAETDVAVGKAMVIVGNIGMHENPDTVYGIYSNRKQDLRFDVPYDVPDAGYLGIWDLGNPTSDFSTTSPNEAYEGMEAYKIFRPIRAQLSQCGIYFLFGILEGSEKKYKPKDVTEFSNLKMALRVNKAPIGTIGSPPVDLYTGFTVEITTLKDDGTESTVTLLPSNIGLFMDTDWKVVTIDLNSLGIDFYAERLVLINIIPLYSGDTTYYIDDVYLEK